MRLSVDRGWDCTGKGIGKRSEGYSVFGRIFQYERACRRYGGTDFGVLEGEHSSRLAEGCSFEERLRIGWKDVEGETWEELGERSVRAIRQIQGRFQEQDGNILVVTHGMTISQIIKELGDGEVYQAYIAGAPRGMGNCSVTLLEWENGVYCLKAINDLSYRQKGEEMPGREF